MAILVDAECLQQEAANAFLKTLEEPGRQLDAACLRAARAITRDDPFAVSADPVCQHGRGETQRGNRKSGRFCSMCLPIVKASYYLPEHGAYKVTPDDGAMFLYGSMDEAQATPALLKIVLDKTHPGREIALWTLMEQSTAEALRDLKQINKTEFSGEAQSSLKALLTRPELFQPRAKPKTSRQEFVHAFERFLAGDTDPFYDLASEVTDGERDVVAVMKPGDLPLIRKVRRSIIAGGNQHSVEYYNSFTKILMTLVWTPELVK